VILRLVLLLLPTLLAAPVSSRAAAPDTTAATTILLVRHAEKNTTMLGHDVPLSTAGTVRARELARVLGESRVDTIVVTPYRRTRDTAAPLAQRLGDSLLVIDPVDETVRRIRTELRGRTVLVVGHSNTIPAIVEALTGRSVPPFEEGEYDRLDVVTLIPGRPATHVRLRYGAPRATP
jgi:broad specificity phosphatase PhoE